MSRNPNQKIGAKCAAHNRGFERSRSQMNSISARCLRNVRAIVDQQPRRTALRQSGSTRRKLIEHSRVQIFFAKLDQVNACGNRSRDEVEEALEVFS